jgi:flagellar hook assembly protein FlgD
MDMIATTEKVTLSISNIQGRTVWSKSLNPVVGQNEVTWNGKASNGTAASAGTYMVRVSLVDKQGKVTNVDRKTISIRP